MGFPGGSDGKESTYNAGDLCSIPGSGRSPGEGKGYTLQYSGLENSVDCIVYGIAKGWTQVSDFTKKIYKKDLYDADNHDGVITHLEPDILECEVKWALGSTTMNKASGGDGIPVVENFEHYFVSA